jgi:hypothetical protein
MQLQIRLADRAVAATKPPSSLALMTVGSTAGARMRPTMTGSARIAASRGISGGAGYQSTFAPENLTALAHFCVSAATKASSSLGFMIIGSAPRL